MKELNYLLITDGSSDKALTHIITWLLRLYLPDCSIEPHWVDPYQLPNPPKNTSEKLAWQIERGLYLYDKTDVLFVHRDAEKQSREDRIREIEAALESITDSPPTVYVIPVQMMEAWLLIDEMAIRMAAGNPNGRNKLSLPARTRLESLPDPKNDLYQLLKQASGLTGQRRLKKFRPQERIHRLAELIDDYSLLRDQPAFQALEADIESLVQSNNW